MNAELHATPHFISPLKTKMEILEKTVRLMGYPDDTAIVPPVASSALP
jgi:hypothetical protein